MTLTLSLSSPTSTRAIAVPSSVSATCAPPYLLIFRATAGNSRAFPDIHSVAVPSARVAAMTVGRQMVTLRASGGLARRKRALVVVEDFPGGLPDCEHPAGRERNLSDLVGA